VGLGLEADLHFTLFVLSCDPFPFWLAGWLGLYHLRDNLISIVILPSFTIGNHRIEIRSGEHGRPGGSI